MKTKSFPVGRVLNTKRSYGRNIPSEKKVKRALESLAYAIAIISVFSGYFLIIGMGV